MPAKDNEVQDKDHGWRAIQLRLLDADGMETKVGWLTGRPRYPKSRGGTAVAKVAGIQVAVRHLGEAFDRVESKIDARLVKAAQDALDGKRSRHALAQAAQILQRAFQDLIEERGLVKKGILRENIRFIVTERTGGRGRPRRIAGDL